LARPEDQVIVALDVPSRDKALKILDQLDGLIGAFKVGNQLFTAEGPAFVRELTGQGARVFLDLKFHDIPNTVEGACSSAARLGVSILNVHISGGLEMMRAAVRGVIPPSGNGAHNPGTEVAARLRPAIIGVTVLTSINDESLHTVGVGSDVSHQVVRLAMLARTAGLDGVVASPNEIRAIREAVAASDFMIVTPGVRPLWAETGDQRRVATPADAIRDGADYLVIGRPITGQSDPRAAAERVLEEIGSVGKNG
jgi:orotidine-5'-phosphate decarboxylase